MSIARRALPPRLALKSLPVSFSDAPFGNVSLTTSLYVSPVQTIPLCDQTGTPGLVGFTHFHSSTICGAAALMTARTRRRVSPRQSPSSRMRSSIRRDADLPSCEAVGFAPARAAARPGRAGGAGARGIRAVLDIRAPLFFCILTPPLEGYPLPDARSRL